MPSSKPGSRIQNGSGLNQAQQAQARSYSYRLFSELYLKGVTAVSLPYLQQIPDLTAVLPKQFNADAAAASHHELFQFNIFAYESFFLGEDGLVGGDKTAALNQIYFQLGFQTAVPNNQADELGHELACLAFLVSQEATAWENDAEIDASIWQKRQRFFFETHLLRWVPTCLLAIQQQADPFFVALAKLTLDLLLAHYEEFGETPTLNEAETAVSTQDFLPKTQNILENDKTGFKEIAQHLLLPAFSGIYLSRDNIGQLGRRFELPRGFGSREMMLMNLLRTAVQYESLPQLLSGIQESSHKWQTSYQQLANSYPKAKSFLQPWHKRAQATEQMVIELTESSIAE